MRELTPSLLNGLDLDVPPDPLTFTVVQPPAHGHLIKGFSSHYKDMGPERLQSLHVTSFTLQELQQGGRRVLVLCGLVFLLTCCPPATLSSVCRHEGHVHA